MFVLSSLQLNPASVAAFRTSSLPTPNKGRTTSILPRLARIDIPANPSGPAPRSNCIKTVSA
jgi:hypothetical protein